MTITGQSSSLINCGLFVVPARPRDWLINCNWTHICFVCLLPVFLTSSFVCLLFVWKGAPFGASVTPIRAKGGVLFMRSQFPTPRARQAFTPFRTKTEGHTCSALGSSTQGEWQWSTTQPRPEPGQLVSSYSNVSASSIDGMWENAIMSVESHFSVLMMG